LYFFRYCNLKSTLPFFPELLTSILLSCYTAVEKCELHQFFCKEDSRCIHQDLTCDGRNDCADGQDEEDSICRDRILRPPCHSSYKQCGDDLICLPKKLWCDGKLDCVGGDDEKLCSKFTILLTLYKHTRNAPSSIWNVWMKKVPRVQKKRCINSLDLLKVGWLVDVLHKNTFQMNKWISSLFVSFLLISVLFCFIL